MQRRKRAEEGKRDEEKGRLPPSAMQIGGTRGEQHAPAWDGGMELDVERREGRGSDASFLRCEAKQTHAHRVGKQPLDK